MENWGLVTYRMNMLIYEEDTENIAHTQRRDGIMTIGEN
jgi:aminopeptidase N